MARLTLALAAKLGRRRLDLRLRQAPLGGLTREACPHEMHLVLLPCLSALGPPTAMAPYAIPIPNGVVRVVNHLASHATVTPISADLMVLPLGPIHS